MASDYLMRQIEEMARLCSQVLFAKHTEPLPVFDEQGNVTENGVLYGRLRMLCSAGRVNGTGWPRCGPACRAHEWNGARMHEPAGKL